MSLMGVSGKSWKRNNFVQHTLYEVIRAGEFVYDHPFQWGSKRTGPDLAREGVMTGKLYKPNAWHYKHMLDPQALNENSIMPKYPWLIHDDLDVSSLEASYNFV